MRAVIFKKYKYSNTYKYIEDYDLWWKLSNEYKMANIPEFLTYYRIHDSNISVQNDKKQKENTGELLSNRLEKFGMAHNAEELAIHLAICFGYGKQFLNTPEKEKALHKWIQKLLAAIQIKYQISSSTIKKMKRNLIENYTIA
jgi:hypothetical protein